MWMKRQQEPVKWPKRQSHTNSLLALAWEPPRHFLTKSFFSLLIVVASDNIYKL